MVVVDAVVVVDADEEGGGVAVADVSGRSVDGRLAAADG